MKPKSCKVCKEKFQPTRAIQPCCGLDCNVTYALALQKKKEQRQRILERRETKVKLQQFKKKSEWLADAQKVFNSYIRLRDAHLPCISCGNHLSNQYCAGHYRTVGSAPHLRFDERNVHKQCNRYCNMELSGNIIKYRQGLIAKIGLEAVEQLEADQTPQHYSIEEVKAIKVKYKNLIKEMKSHV